MTRESSAVDRIARAFHERYEALAPRYGYRTRPESAVTWENVPDRNRALMVAVVASLLINGVICEPTAPTASDRPVAGEQ